MEIDETVLMMSKMHTDSLMKIEFDEKLINSLIK